VRRLLGVYFPVPQHPRSDLFSLSNRVRAGGCLGDYADVRLCFQKLNYTSANHGEVIDNQKRDA